MAASALRRGLVVAGVLALPYVPFLLGLDLRAASPSAATAAAALLGAAALGAPGAAGMLLGRGRGAARRVVQALAGAVLANVAAMIALRLAGVEPGPTSFAAALGAMTVAAGVAGHARGGRVPDPRRAPAAAVIFGAAFLLAAEAGLDVVPPLEDQDSEVQGTAPGLVQDLAPVCLTNRSTLHYFAHPPLLHALAASTLTLAGQLPAVRAAHDAAREELSTIPAAERRGWPAVAKALRGGIPRRDYSLRWWRDVYGAFVADPALLGTRAPNFVLAAVAATLLFLWLLRLGATSFDAGLLVAVYATLPEVFVRSGYGGYYAIDAATWLAAAWLATGSAGGGRAGYFAGGLGALADQKLLLFGAVAAAVANARALVARHRSALLRALPLVLGMAAASLAFWVYGLAVAPADFVTDHWREHGLARFVGTPAKAGPGQLAYPSRAALWLELGEHYGIWAALAAGAVLAGIARARGGRDETGAATLLVAWTAAVAIVFTLADWRQTKHLALFVPAATLLIGMMLAEARPGPRVALRLALVAALAWNVAELLRLARDFESMSATPLW
ncbi:MAG: hypothetical protein U0167_17835 [bacterium]